MGSQEVKKVNKGDPEYEKSKWEKRWWGKWHLPSEF